MQMYKQTLTANALCVYVNKDNEEYPTGVTLHVTQIQ